MRKIGVIGGTSWSSTALYYDHINRGVAQRLGGLHSAPMVIESLDLAPIAEMELSGDWDRVAHVSIEAAKRLEAAGAEGVIITSNTGHKVFDAVAKNIGVPMLHIADATGDKLVADGVRSAALIGTRFTMTEPYVRNRLEARGITLAPIPPEWIQEVDRIIFEELAAGRVVRDSQRQLKTLFTEVAKHKTEAIVLGCTELCLAVDTRANVLPVYDTTAIHARATVEWMLAEKADTVARAAA